MTVDRADTLGKYKYLGISTGKKMKLEHDIGLCTRSISYAMTCLWAL